MIEMSRIELFSIMYLIHFCGRENPAALTDGSNCQRLIIMDIGNYFNYMLGKAVPIMSGTKVLMLE